MSELVTMYNLDHDRKVRRGPDWCWENQDGNGEGVIITELPHGKMEYHSAFWVRVQWDTGRSNTYRAGPDKHDLEYTSEPTMFRLLDDLDKKIQAMEERTHNGKN